MSRATLYVRFPDGTLRYGLYCGTSDTVWPKLYATPYEAWDAYDSDGGDDFQPGDGDPVLVAQDYGGGGWWAATATYDYVTSGHYDDDHGWHDGLPDWAKYPEVVDA